MLQNEFGIPMTVEINEEMNRMCNLSEALIDKGREEGMEPGAESCQKSDGKNEAGRLPGF